MLVQARAEQTPRLASLPGGVTDVRFFRMTAGSGPNAIHLLGASDTTPPIISNIFVSNITMNSATISWMTNEPATSFVDYDATSGSSVLVLSHVVQLSGLSKNTTYTFRVRSADATSNSSTSAPQMFTTKKNKGR